VCILQEQYKDWNKERALEYAIFLAAFLVFTGMSSESRKLGSWFSLSGCLVEEMRVSSGSHVGWLVFLGVVWSLFLDLVEDLEDLVEDLEFCTFCFRAIVGTGTPSTSSSTSSSSWLTINRQNLKNRQLVAGILSSGTLNFMSRSKQHGGGNMMWKSHSYTGIPIWKFNRTRLVIH